MKSRICFVPESFDLDKSDEDIYASLKNIKLIILSLDSDFIAFCNSADFHTYVASKLITTSPDRAYLMSQFYDIAMSKAETLDIASDEVVEITKNTPPVYKQRWTCLYHSSKKKPCNLNPERTVHSEKEIVDFCSEILVNNPPAHDDYAKYIQSIYKNIIFLDYPKHKNYKTFNRLRHIDGGYENFIGRITQFLSYANEFDLDPREPLKNVKTMSTSLDFPVTPEGTGKNKREIKALKRDFLYKDKEYKDVNCEFHYKLEHVDNKGDKTYYYNRIYFGFFNRIEKEKTKIAIAHIGEHL
ncbi:hypothetical protein [Kosakonia cowanii]|uniref:hypothetical protein n=1 Tax=Kosakonia cowanii TaxID=208223 RepID=UPI0025A97281|nr:hypothetical protein [Kosakonia cowanii]MDM9616867.1 hypothetical protein [Kosakonia cowanii]MDP4561865.1 hypothetical protein [Kosakonia cowanii]